jgi:hypothetical protein
MNKEELIKMRDTLNDWIKSFEGDEQEEIEEVEIPKGLKYKAGDLIILRDDLKDYKTYGDYFYNPPMSYLKDKYSRIDDMSFDTSTYYIDGWYIPDEMIDHDKSLYLNSFTKDERQFLSYFCDKYKWIAKDRNSSREVWVYDTEPTMNPEGTWGTTSMEMYSLREDVFSFSFDKLGTDQPVRIYKDLNY